MSKHSKLILVIFGLFYITTFSIVLLIPLFSNNHVYNFEFGVSDGIQLIVISLAILAPIIVDDIRKNRDKPIITVHFDEEPPCCHKTLIEVRTSHPPGVGPKKITFPIYYFRIKVINTGKSIMKNCEVLLNSIYWKENGTYNKIDNFSEVHLNWAGTKSKLIDLNPNRPVFCDLGQIGNSNYQSGPEKVFPGHFDIKEIADREGLRFLFCLMEVPFSQPNCFLPGDFRFGVTIFTENAGSKDLKFEVNWSGKWQDSTEAMFSEFIIRQISDS